MIKRYQVIKIVLGNSLKEVLDVEQGDIISVDLCQNQNDISADSKLGFIKENGNR